MNKNSLPARALSIALSSMLAFTLVPSAAFAANADTAAAEDAQVVQTDEAASAASEESAANSSDASTSAETSAAASAPAVVNEEHDLTAGSTAAAETEATQVPERIRAEVNVANNAVTVITYNNMSFQLSTDEGTPTATLVGFSVVPEGALEIPAAVTSAGTAYTVANISSPQNLGGGVRAPR